MTFDRKWKVQLPLALGLSLISGYSLILSANADESTAANQSTSDPNVVAKPNITINNIYLNDNKQLVIEFDNPAHLSLPSPEVRDYPGQQHDIVLEFPQTSFAVDKVPRAKVLLDQLMKAYPTINSVAYASANDGTKARIRVGLLPQTASHPALVNAGEESAIISLDLSEIINPTVANKDTNNTVANSAPTQSKIVAAPATVAPAVVASPEAGVTTKTVNNIKTQVNKLAKLGDKINPLGIFGHSKQSGKPTTVASSDSTNTQSPVKADTITVNNTEEQKTIQAPAESSTQAPQITEATPEAAKAIASNTSQPPVAATLPENNTNLVTTTAPANPANAEVTAAAPPTSETVTLPIKADNVTVSANSSPLKPEITESVSSVPATTPPAQAQAATEVSAPSVAQTAKPEQASPQQVQSIKPIEAAILANSSALKSETKETNSEASTVSNSNNAQPIIPIETIATDKAQPLLPRIPTTAEGNIAGKVNNESLITPLSVDQVVKEKADLSAQIAQTAQNSQSSAPDNAGQVLATKETTGDKSIADDLKTGFTQPKPEAEAKVEPTENKEEVADKDKDKKDEPEKIASIPAGDTLDSLTNAAVKNKSEGEADSQNTALTVAAADAIKLKAQKARIGGKDYLPPKFADDAVDHYNAAVQFHLNGKLTEAAAEYQAAVEADPKIAEAYSNLGLIFNQQRKYDQAMDQFHKALMINPKDAITYNGIGAAMRAQNNMIAAVKNWKTAITLDPNLASAHYNLGTAYELQKDYDKALGEYKEAIKHDDKLGEAYYRMGLILQKMDNKNLALQEYKNAIKISQQATYAPDAKRRINLLSQSKNQSM